MSPIPEVEVAGEGDLEPFADAERAVALNLDGHVRLEQGEAVGPGGRREGKRDRHRRGDRDD